MNATSLMAVLRGEILSY